MKKVIFVFSLLMFTGFCFAAKILPVKIIMKNGSVLEGYSPRFTNEYQSNVYFYKTKDSKKEKIASESIKSITYTDKDGSNTLEFITTYRGYDTKKTNPPFWINQLVVGYASLYVRVYIWNNVQFNDYFIIREGEKAATYISATASFNNNAVFKKQAPKYFADYPELVQKINSGDLEYKDLSDIVDLYNSWIESKNNKDDEK